MERSSHFDYCVVGAGASGLTLAHQLLSAGKRVLLVERDSRAGGLAKSYYYRGHTFDTGPKRFHTDDPKVLDFLSLIMGEGLSTIGRASEVYFLDRYFGWPLTRFDLLKLPPGVAARCVRDLFRKSPTVVGRTDSFEEHIVGKYGETLYRLFFEPYTRKFLRWDPADIHADWALTGINRSVVDSTIRAGRLGDIVRMLTTPAKADTRFLYPETGGFGAFFDRIFSRCSEFPDFSVRLGDRFRCLRSTGASFCAELETGGAVQFDDLLWTGNLNDLLALVDPRKEASSLCYLNTLFYQVVCRESQLRSRRRSQWIYVSRGDSLVSRITCMKEFSPTNCPEGYANFIVEVTDSQRHPIYWPRAEALRDEILRELVSMSFLKSVRGVEEVIVRPVRDTYPIYHRRFARDFSAAVARVRAFSRRIRLVGRSGAYWYNNSDHSIRMALDMAAFLLGQQEKTFDPHRHFGGELSEDLAA